MTTELDVLPAPLVRQASTMCGEAQTLTISDASQYATAMNLGKALKAMLDQVVDACRPQRETTTAAWKAAIAFEDEHTSPLKAALKLISIKTGTWHQEQKRLLEAEEIRLREIQRRKDEEVRLAEAVELEKAGFGDVAEALMTAPVPARATVLAPLNTPTVEGTSVRYNIKFRIVDARLLPREYTKPDEVAIGKEARKTDPELIKAHPLGIIPGVEVYLEPAGQFSGG